MFFHSLPIELLDDICQNVARVDLVALSQTSTLLYPVAQRLLYRTVSISPLSHNLSVVVTLAHRPDVARFVRSFSLNLGSSPLFHSYHVLLATALSHMSELTSLDIYISSGASWVLTTAPKPITYPRLQRLACAFPLDSHVIQFLDKSPALRELELDSTTAFHSSALKELSPSLIPRLGHFIGSCEAAKLIVPGRPIGSIHLVSGDLTEDDLKCLAKGTTRVLIFGATTRFLPRPLLDLLELLPRHLPHIVYLRIMTSHTFPTAPDVVSLSFLNVFNPI
jgi:hypothetical protein